LLKALFGWINEGWNWYNIFTMINQPNDIENTSLKEEPNNINLKTFISTILTSLLYSVAIIVIFFIDILGLGNFNIFNIFIYNSFIPWFIVMLPCILFFIITLWLFWRKRGYKVVIMLIIFEFFWLIIFSFAWFIFVIRPNDVYVGPRMIQLPIVPVVIPNTQN
jgi:hypothetical protein